MLGIIRYLRRIKHQQRLDDVLHPLRTIRLCHLSSPLSSHLYNIIFVLVIIQPPLLSNLLFVLLIIQAIVLFLLLFVIRTILQECC